MLNTYASYLLKNLGAINNNGVSPSKRMRNDAAIALSVDQWNHPFSYE